MRREVISIEKYTKGKWKLVVQEAQKQRLFSSKWTFRTREFVGEGHSYDCWFELPDYDLVSSHSTLAEFLYAQLERYKDNQELAMRKNVVA